MSNSTPRNKINDSEDKLQIIINNIRDIVTEMDLNGNFIYVSPQVYDILGYKSEEVIGLSGFKFVHQDDLPNLAKKLGKLMRTGGSMVAEYRALHNDGHYVHISAKGAIVKENGNTKLIAVLRDISIQKESEQKYRLLANNINDIIWTMNLNLKTTYVSPSVKGILGYTVDEDIARSATEKFTPESLKKISKMLRKHITPNRIKDKNYNPLIRIEVDQYHKSGSIIPCEITVTPMRDKSGVAFGLVGITRNITKRKEAEQKLKESEEKYRALFENSPQAVGLLNKKGIVVQGNSNVEKIFGYKKEEYIGHKFTEFPFFSKEHNAIVLESLKKLNKGEIAEPRELQLHRKDGSIIWVSMQSSIVKLKDETLFQFITQDISKLKEAEMILEEKNKALQELNDLKTEFLRRASHELKTPLAIIKGNADLVMTSYNEALEPRVAKRLEEIQKGCDRLGDIIHKLIESSRLETSEIELHTSKGNLLSFIQLCVLEVQPLVKVRNLNITFEVTDIISTEFNKDQIREVILNLLHNAVNYSPPNGNIAINYEIKSNTIIISIKDRGIGFTEDEKIRIFQKFGKISRKNQGFDVISEGSGLGLYLAKMIIELHGGEIWVESEGRNKGSTFFFTLPII